MNNKKLNKKCNKRVPYFLTCANGSMLMLPARVDKLSSKSADTSFTGLVAA